MKERNIKSDFDLVKKILVKDFEMKILSIGDCKTFLPCSFNIYDDELRIEHQIEGSSILDKSSIVNPYILLDYIDKIFVAIQEAREHLIDVKRYKLDVGNIFIQEESKMVKLKFEPSEDKTLSVEKWLSDFLENLKKTYDEKAYVDYIDMIVKKIEYKNGDIHSIINYVYELKRDAYLCGWKDMII